MRSLPTMALAGCALVGCALVGALVTSCGARSALEVDPAQDAGQPDAFSFDTFTCRWSYVDPPWTVASGTRVERAALHTREDTLSGAFTTGDRFVGFDLRPPPDGLPHGSVPSDQARLAWPRNTTWHVLGAEGDVCAAATWSSDLLTLLQRRTLAGETCAYDPIGAEVAHVVWGERVEVFAIGDGLAGPRIARLFVASDGAPRVARERDGTTWVSTRSGGAVTVHAVRDGAVVGTIAPGDAALAPALAPDRLRGGVIAAMWDGATMRLVRVSFGAGGLERFELAALDADPEPPFEIVTTEAEILVARADGSYTSVPLSGAAPRAIRAPEDGAGPGALAMRDGTSFGYVVYPLGGQIRARLLECNR